MNIHYFLMLLLANVLAPVIAGLALPKLQKWLDRKD